jgi:hypothetical protein
MTAVPGLMNAREQSPWRRGLDEVRFERARSGTRPHAIRMARQRLVLCRLMIEIMRSLHGTYAPKNEPFGTRLETFFIGLCVALGQFEQKPFSVTKIAAFMHVPRTTVIRRLEQLQSWGLVQRQGKKYYMDELALNSLLGLKSYRRIRGLIEKARAELTVLDTLPD